MKSSNSIKTFTGKYLNPLDMRLEHIIIEDIAHSLSLLCRGGGHIKHFFSVAQHSINCAIEARERGYSKRVQLACLLHDASEAYISDITRPVKRQLSQYIEIEKMIQGNIWIKHFNEPLTKGELELVDKIYELMLHYELKHLLEEEIHIEDNSLFMELVLDERDCKNVENEFINVFRELYI